jgi:hypothetical protein
MWHNVTKSSEKSSTFAADFHFWNPLHLVLTRESFEGLGYP